jgi:hypothetical protein
MRCQLFGNSTENYQSNNSSWRPNSFTERRCCNELYTCNWNCTIKLCAESVRQTREAVSSDNGFARVALCRHSHVVREASKPGRVNRNYAFDKILRYASKRSEWKTVTLISLKTNNVPRTVLYAALDCKLLSSFFFLFSFIII